jgi:uncharacterized protein YgiM (DUF1202 family)
MAAGRKQPFHLISEDGGRVHGWVAAVDVSAIAVAPPTPPAFAEYRVRVTANALNIRRGPGTNHALTGQVITDRGVYTIIEESSGQGANRWGRLKSGAGWIALDFTTKI